MSLKESANVTEYYTQNTALTFFPYSEVSSQITPN